MNEWLTRYLFVFVQYHPKALATCYFDTIATKICCTTFFVYPGASNRVHGHATNAENGDASHEVVINLDGKISTVLKSPLKMVPNTHVGVYSMCWSSINHCAWNHCTSVWVILQFHIKRILYWGVCVCTHVLDIPENVSLLSNMSSWDLMQCILLRFY